MDINKKLYNLVINFIVMQDINEEEKKSIYLEALNLFNKKSDFIKETIQKDYF